MVHGRFRWVLGLIALALVLIPASVIAQDGDSGDDDSVIVQVNRPLTLDTGDSVNVVVVVDDDAVIDGEVADALVIISGTATVRGTVDGDIFVYDGALVLEESATVDDVTLIRSDLTRAEGATVTGSLDEEADFTAFGAGFAWISIAFQIAIGIAILVISLVIMAFFGRPIQRAAALISTQPLPSAVAGLGTWIVLFIVAIVALVTIIGIPVSLGIFLFLMPILALMGHIVASYWVGSRLGGLMNLQLNPYLLFIIGLVVVQLVGIVPFIGGLIVFIVSLLGTGALVLYLWRARQSPVADPVVDGSMVGSGTV